MSVSSVHNNNNDDDHGSVTLTDRCALEASCSARPQASPQSVSFGQASGQTSEKKFSAKGRLGLNITSKPTRCHSENCRILETMTILWATGDGPLTTSAGCHMKYQNNEILE